MDHGYGSYYKILSLPSVGSGRNGDVRLFNKKTVVKRVEIKEDNDIPNLIREIKTLKAAKGYHDLMSIQDSNCIYQAGYTNQPNLVFYVKLYLFMEKKQGTFFDAIVTNYVYTVEIMWKIDMCIKIARAVSNLHSLGLIHRDIKPENILINEKTKYMTITPVLLEESFKESQLLRTWNSLVRESWIASGIH